MKTLLAIILIFCTIPSYASEQEPIEVCDQWSKVAEAIMTARQSKVSVGTLLDSLDKNHSKVNVAVDMIMRAYEKPLYSLKEYKMKSIREFSNDIYIECLREHQNAGLL